MATLLVENSAERVALFPDVLQQIAKDVALGFQTTTLPEHQISIQIGNFVRTLGEQIDEERYKFRPGGEYHVAIKDLMDRDLSEEPLAGQVQMVIQINALTDEEKKRLVAAGLTKLRHDYLSTSNSIQNPKASSQAWQAFVQAHARYHAYPDSDQLNEDGYEYSGTFPLWGDVTRVYIHLPIILSDDSYDKPRSELNGDILANMHLQTAMARTTGILLPDETFQDLAKRDIKYVTRFHGIRPEEQDLVLCELLDQYSSLKGMPSSYNNVPTKYPGIQAYVIFDDRSRSTVETRNPDLPTLNVLIEEGLLAPRIMLKVPTATFLSA